MSFIPKPHEIYKHFKGNLYQIVAIAEHSETGEQLVVYQALYDDFKTYARPLAMFTSPVDKKKYPEITQEFRFELQGPDSDRQKKAAGESETDTGAEKGHIALQKSKQENDILAGENPDQRAQGIAVERKEVQENAVRGEAAGEDLSEHEVQLDPMVLEFLDSDSYEERLNILAGLHHRITDDMITTMAIASDVEVDEGDLEERYESLKNCLLTLEKYECNRIR